MSKTISIICKLPNGIIIENPNDPRITVTLRGAHAATIVGADYAVTDVDAEFWGAWIAKHADFGPVKSGAIFAAKSVEAASAEAKDRAEQKTGLEAMSTDGKDARAAGVKADKV